MNALWGTVARRSGVIPRRSVAAPQGFALMHKELVLCIAGRLKKWSFSEAAFDALLRRLALSNCRLTYTSQKSRSRIAEARCDRGSHRPRDRHGPVAWQSARPRTVPATAREFAPGIRISTLTIGGWPGNGSSWLAFLNHLNEQPFRVAVDSQVFFVFCLVAQQRHQVFPRALFRGRARYLVRAITDGDMPVALTCSPKYGRCRCRPIRRRGLWIPRDTARTSRRSWRTLCSSPGAANRSGGISLLFRVSC